MKWKHRVYQMRHLVFSMHVTYCHGVKRVRIRSYSSPHFSHIFPHSDWIRGDTPYLSIFSPNAGKSGKNADQNNSEYGLFLRSVFHSLWIYFSISKPARVQKGFVRPTDHCHQFFTRTGHKWIIVFLTI